MARNYGKNAKRSIRPITADDEDEDDGPTAAFPTPEPPENRGAYDKETSEKVLGRKTGDDNVYSPEIMPRNDETDI